jgi:hypothetical protein
MSAGAVFQQALRIVCRHPLPDAAHADVLRALEAARPGGLLELLCAAGHEAGLAREALHERAAAAFFVYAAGQLADDLADGDCDYLDEPLRTGPSLVFLLLQLASATLAGSVPADVHRAAAADLVAGTGPQQVEVRTRRWSAALAQEVAEGIAGRQIAAYLRILWAGTPLAPHAPGLGRDLGVASHVAADARSGDPRYASLPQDERRALREWALAGAERALGVGLRSIAAALAEVVPVLRSSA